MIWGRRLQGVQGCRLPGGSKDPGGGVTSRHRGYCGFGGCDRPATTKRGLHGVLGGGLSPAFRRWGGACSEDPVKQLSSGSAYWGGGAVTSRFQGLCRSRGEAATLHPTLHKGGGGGCPLVALGSADREKSREIPPRQRAPETRGIPPESRQRVGRRRRCAAVRLHRSGGGCRPPRAGGEAEVGGGGGGGHPPATWGSTDPEIPPSCGRAWFTRGAVVRHALRHLRAAADLQRGATLDACSVHPGFFFFFCKDWLLSSRHFAAGLTSL